MSQNLQKRNSQTSVAPQQKPSDGKSFPELMKALDNAKVDMPAEDLLRILKFCEGDRNLMNDFNVFRRRKWFVMIGRLRPTEINTAQLIKMMEYLIRLDLRPERYHAKFYPGWEVLIIELLDPAELMKVLAIYQKLNADLPGQLVKKWCKVGSQNFDRVLKTQDMPMIIYTFAAFKVRPDEYGFIEKWWQKTRADLSTFDADDLASIVYGIGKLEIKIPPEEFEQLVNALVNKRNQFVPTAFIRCLYGFAYMKKYPKEPLKEFEAINFLKLESEMKNLKPGSMSRLMWSLGRLNIMPSQNFLTIFYDQFAKLGTECKAQDVALCMEGIVKLGLKPNQRFMEAWQNAAISKMEEIWPESWVTFPGNLQRCDFKPSRTFWDSFLKIGPEKLKELVTSANMIAVLEGLRLHNIKPNEYDGKFMEKWQELMELRALTLSEQQKKNVLQLFKDLNVTINPMLGNRLN